MSTIAPIARFDAVPRLEVSDTSLAGPDGAISAQTQALANRDQMLFERVEKYAVQLGVAGNAAEARSRLGINGVALGYNPRGAWSALTGGVPTVYNPLDYIVVSGHAYTALYTHTVGASFAADLAAGRWVPLLPLMGEDISSRLVAFIDSIASLRLLGKTAYRVVSVTGYHAGSRDGGGTFCLDPDDTTTADNAVTVIVGADGGRWKLRHDGWLSAMQGGALGNDTPGDDVFVQKVFDTGLHVFFPEEKTFNFTDWVRTKPGQKVAGFIPGNFGTDKRSYVHNDLPGGGCFGYGEDDEPVQRKMPSFVNLSLRADFPIRFNDETTAIIHNDPGISNVPFGMRPVVLNCDIKPRVNGVGIGVSASKVFDGVFEFNEIEHFAVDLLLNGCDLNRVKHNRFKHGHLFHILELSRSTFGSQNQIEHNDILEAGSTACIFIKSNAQHARLYDNYLEHSAGTAGAAFVGFVDLSNVGVAGIMAALGMPSGNPSTARFTAVAVHNRIDGHKYPSTFTYRYEPVGQTFGEIIDVGTTGEPVTSPAKVLLLCDSTGADIDAVPVTYAQLNTCIYKFRGPGFGKWDGYETTADYALEINSRNIRMYGSQLYTTRLDLALFARGDRLVLKNGFAYYMQLALPANTPLLVPGDRYSIYVEARCLSGTESLELLYIRNGSGLHAATTCVLDQKFRRFTNLAEVSSTGSDVSAISLFRATNNGSDIEMRVIGYEKEYTKQQARQAASSVTFSADTLTGYVDVRADGSGSSYPAFKRFGFVMGELVELGGKVTDPTAIDVSGSRSGNTLTFAISGAGSGKGASVGHRV